MEKQNVYSNFYGEPVILNDDEVKLVELAGKYTQTKYAIVTNDKQEKVVDAYTLICAIEDLLYEIDEKEFEIHNLDNQLEEYLENK